MDEQRENIDDVEIIYRYKPRKYDNSHLVIVFSGFGAGAEFTYDFERVLQDCPAHVIWIKDDFGNHSTYYLCKDLNFKIRDSIYKFIMMKLAKFNLRETQCTLLGFSKGGSAALYFGLTYNFNNVVATVPQLRIGSYVSKHWPVTAENMMGDITAEKKDFLDKLVPNALKAGKNKNIYIFTSPSDPQYNDQIKPFLPEFFRVANFNMFYLNSRLIRSHSLVTAHSVPLILSVVNSLVAGAVPRYGYVEPEFDQTELSNPIEIRPLAVLYKVRFSNGRIFPEGISVLRGVPCAEYSDIKSDLIFTGERETVTRPLAKVSRPSLSRQLYDGAFVDYDKGWFCTHKHQGLDIDLIPAGLYQLSVRIACRNIVHTCELAPAQEMNIRWGWGGYSVSLYTEKDRVWFKKT